MSKSVEVIVTAKESHVDHLAELTTRLKQAGMQVGQVLDFTGQVIGHCDSDRVKSISRLAGVAAVEQSRGVSVPPPDSEVQ